MKKLLALAALAIGLFGCGGGSNDASVTYSVTGSASRAALTYETASGDSAQETVALPWSKTLTSSPGKFLYVSAQNQGALGTVTTSITVDGKLFKSTTSSGGYVIATASGSCC